jgi:hypothetical protein
MILNIMEKTYAFWVKNKYDENNRKTECFHHNGDRIIKDIIQKINSEEI